MIWRKLQRQNPIWQRSFSNTFARREILSVENLPDRIIPRYLGRLSRHCRSDYTDFLAETPNSDLLSLQWPAPPRNILMIKKDRAPGVNDSVIEYAKSVPRQ